MLSRVYSLITSSTFKFLSFLFLFKIKAGYGLGFGYRLFSVVFSVTVEFLARGI
ncbi:hypothetical protein BDZ91DRAFT_729843 [Kalaharituber pfeilii]|nr:hypothetical protein BDZ91DRAFT_729843 [Kalaharituber pfeilii]